MSCCDATQIVIKNTLSNMPMVVTVQSISITSGALMTNNNKSGTPLAAGAAVPLGQTTTWYAFSSDGSNGAAEATVTLQLQWLSQITTVQMYYKLTPKDHFGDPPCTASYSISAESSGNCFNLAGLTPDYQGNPNSAPILTWVLEWLAQDGCSNPPGPDIQSWTASAPQGGIWQPGNQVQYGVCWVNQQGGYEYGSQTYWGPAVTITDGAYPVVENIPTDPTNAGYVRWLMRQNPQHPSTGWLYSFGTDNTTTTYTDTNN